MIILGLINFSEEQRLFGYWKKVNKALKRKEIVERSPWRWKAPCMANDNVHSGRLSERINRYEEVYGENHGEEQGLAKGKPKKKRNINLLINKKSILLEPYGPNGSKLDLFLESLKSSRVTQDMLYRKKNNCDPMKKRYYLELRDHPDNDRGLFYNAKAARAEKIRQEYDKLREEDPRYKEQKRKMKLRESIKKKEEKIKHLKKIKNIKRAGLIGAGVVGTAGLAYGGYKYLQNKKKKNIDLNPLKP